MEGTEWFVGWSHKALHKALEIRYPSSKSPAFPPSCEVSCGPELKASKSLLYPFRADITAYHEYQYRH
jgi:hypothetical protein